MSILYDNVDSAPGMNQHRVGKNAPARRISTDPNGLLDSRKVTPTSSIDFHRKLRSSSTSPPVTRSSLDGHLDSIFESDEEHEGSDPEIPSLSSHLSNIIKNKQKWSSQHRFRGDELDEEENLTSNHEDTIEDEEDYPFSYSLTKHKTDSIQILDQYFRQMASHSWICHVHIKAHINAWKLFSFENSDSVEEAIQLVVETLSEINNQKLNWKDYIFSFPDQTGRVIALPYNAILKSYGRVIFFFFPKIFN